jgi:hypothetical protein
MIKTGILGILVLYEEQMNDMQSRKTCVIFNRKIGYTINYKILKIPPRYILEGVGVRGSGCAYSLNQHPHPHPQLSTTPYIVYHFCK